MAADKGRRIQHRADILSETVAAGELTSDADLRSGK